MNFFRLVKKTGFCQSIRLSNEERMGMMKQAGKGLSDRLKGIAEPDERTLKNQISMKDFRESDQRKGKNHFQKKIC